jgi:hypothetical protein
MGGLVARSFLETVPQGPALARRLITIGTPHLGAPQAYLHLIGRTHPFRESLFATGAHAAMARELRAAGIALQGDFATQLIPGQIQTALLRFMASAFELLPRYDFVTSQGRAEPYPTTYGNEVHSGTGWAAMRIIETFRKGMIHELQLDSWLQRLGLEYHFLGVTGFATVSGYDRGATASSPGRRATGRCRSAAPSSSRRAPGSCSRRPSSAETSAIRTCASGATCRRTV